MHLTDMRREQVLFSPPKLLAEGERAPSEGWAILADTWLIRDGETIGVHPEWLGVGKLRYEPV